MMPQIVDDIPAAEISRAQDVLHFVRHKQLAEFRRQIVDPVRNMQVANQKHQLKISIFQHLCWFLQKHQVSPSNFENR